MPQAPKEDVAVPGATAAAADPTAAAADPAAASATADTPDIDAIVENGQQAASDTFNEVKEKKNLRMELGDFTDAAAEQGGNVVDAVQNAAADVADSFFEQHSTNYLTS